MMQKAAVPFRIVLFGATFALSACVNFGSSNKNPPLMYQLTSELASKDGASQSADAKDALVVLIPDVPRKLETNRIAVQVNENNVAYLKEAIWSDKPARLMQMLIMERVSASGERLVLNEVDAGGKAQEILSGTLLEFGVDAARGEAVVVYDAVRLHNGKAVEKRRFEAREPVGMIVAANAAPGLNKAANRVAAAMTGWLLSRP